LKFFKKINKLTKKVTYSLNPFKTFDKKIIFKPADFLRRKNNKEKENSHEGIFCTEHKYQA